MLILSFDVGIIHLAYCLFTKEDNKWKIIDWNNIDLTDRECTKCECGLKASFVQHNKFYCKVHSKKCETIKLFEELFKNNNENNCSVLVKDTICGRKTNYEYDNCKYCTTHAKSKYKALQTSYKLKPYKNTNVSALNFDNTKLKLFQILEEKINLLTADIVLIENQPSFTNPLMKSIAISLYDYYLIRGILDKSKTNSNIKSVKFMAPCNKIKLVKNEDNTIQLINDKSTDKTVKYKLTKALGIKYTLELIEHLPDWIKFLNGQHKKDDLADSFLQGVYYYEKNLSN